MFRARLGGIWLEGRTARPLDKPRLANIFNRVADIGNIADAYRSALRGPATIKRLILVRFEQLISVGDGPAVRGVGDSAFGEVGVGGLQTFCVPVSRLMP